MNRAEQSLTADFSESLLKKFKKAVKDYRLIEAGDKICVCVSGGKDSLLLAKLIQEYGRHGGTDFDAVYLMLDPGFDSDVSEAAAENFRVLDIPAEIKAVNIFKAAEKSGKNPCFTCSRIRRAELYRAAAERGCRKIALGHHFDDVIETILMGMLYGGQMQTMLPRRAAEHFAGMELIRPMYYIREHDIRLWTENSGIAPVSCACPMSDGKTAGSKRAEIKRLIAELKKINPQIESNIFRSAENVNLKNLISYKDSDGLHSFMDTEIRD